MASTLLPIVLQQLAVILDREMEGELILLRGAKKEVEKLSSTLRSIEAVLNDAEKRQLKEEAVRDWIDKLKGISYDIDDVVDEWRTATVKEEIPGDEHIPFRRKVSSCSYILSPCICFSQVVFNREIAVKIRRLNGRLDVIAREKNLHEFRTIQSIEEIDRPRTTSIVDISEICGRDKDKDKLVGYLTSETVPGKRNLHMVCIVGMGGIGKTTLAQLVFNDKEVQTCFEIRVWTCVSDPFDETRIAKAIIEAIEGRAPNLTELETLLQRVRDLTEGKKFFLVLDDVWTEDFRKWEPLRDTLKYGAPGSRILITTRKEGVATMMGCSCMHPLGELSEEDCWWLFSQIAFSERDPEERRQLEDLGRVIAHKCNGLPLAAKTLGSLMRLKKTREEWHYILDSEIWKLEEAERGLFPPLLLSYYDLPSAVRRCFSYCAVFPKDHKIAKNELIKLWMAQGFLSSRGCTEMELKGREYFDSLVTRSFFQDFEKDKVDGSIQRCKMHDIVHDFAQFLTKNECMILEVNGPEELTWDSDSRKARHSTLVVAATAPFPVSISNADKLRTLSIRHEDNKRIAYALPELCRRLTCLRALNLRNSLIDEAPEELGKLVHLRYLNLSKTKLVELPESVCSLSNLQTFNLTDCQCLQKLPQGIGKLIELRHLEIDRTLSLRVLPKGIARLDSLRTLSRFLVSGPGVSQASKIDDLQKLNCLRKKIRIEGLGNVTDVSQARNAQLKDKRHLNGLEFVFTGDNSMQRIDEDVLEALQPHTGIEHVSIYHHRGTTVFPSWIMSLSNLKGLVLDTCGHCKFLPPLGKLQSLESLGFFNMNSVELVDLKFLGLGIDHGGSESLPVTLFPRLKELGFHGMKGWQKWEGMIATGRDEDAQVKIMPSLCYLHINDCPKLMALPHYLQSMRPKELIIYECPFLKQNVQEMAGVNWDMISHIPNIKIDDRYVQKDLHFVREAEPAQVSVLRTAAVLIHPQVAFSCSCVYVELLRPFFFSVKIVLILRHLFISIFESTNTFKHSIRCALCFLYIFKN